MAFSVRFLRCISKGLGIKHNLVLSLGFHMKFGTFVTHMVTCGNVTWRVLRWRVKLGRADFATVFTVVVSLNGNCIFTVDLGLSVCLNCLVTGLTSHFHNSTFEMLLIVGLCGVSPVITSVTIHFTNNFEDEWMWGWMRMRVCHRRWW